MIIFDSCSMDSKEKAVIMESEYDRKFEDMKKYIPFLENMIRRLESASPASANPRQAQLDKIRSLRDLLLDKKKRMKMENLLKCEQVLVNLYAKVEQRDSLPGIRKASDPLFPSDASTETQKSDLNSARRKLKTVSTNGSLPENDPDTLPEIAPASETEVICTPGSKEPALFQRRPNKNSRSPTRKSPTKDGVRKKSPHKTVPKRNYTRVLVSPEPHPRRWNTSKVPAADQPLFSRRSRKTPRKSSPSKKDQKSSTQSKPRDLNITLNVPEESLDSLKTGDILSRIIKCPDDDVDIDTLRDLRTQILSELKQTGTNDDISDLILKSYRSKKTKRKRKEVEEGELSDSESEAIERIYGSLVVVDDEENNIGKSASASTDKDQARKIQICLVINSDKEESTDQTKVTEVTDFEVFDIEKNDTEVSNQHENQKDRNTSESVTSSRGNPIHTSITKNKDFLTIEVEDDEDLKKDDTSNIERKESDGSCIDISSSDNDSQSPKTKRSESKANTPFKANFYNEQKGVEKDAPTIISEDQSHSICEENNKSISETPQEATKMSSTIDACTANLDNTNVSKILPVTSELATPVDKEDNVEIPLLNTEPTVPSLAKIGVSEIDILQALKNEILSDSISIPGSDVTTPLLHQPKVTKVASAQEIMVKKRISIEKYKEKSVKATKTSLFLKDPNISTQPSENSKKSSLKLTPQEQQRFQILPLPLDSSDEEEKESTPSAEDVYADLAPRSPENNDLTITEPSAPIIIPVDPVKPTIAMSKADVDMRTLNPIPSPTAPKPTSKQFPLLMSNTLSEPNTNRRTERESESRRAPLLDPRVRRDLGNNGVAKDSPNPHTKNMEISSRSSGNFSSVPSIINPNRTPNARCEMTPRQSFDFEDSSTRKHVYAPFPSFEPRDQREQSVNRETQGPRWEPNAEPLNALMEDHNSRWDTGPSRKWNDRDQRSRTTLESGLDYYKPRYEADKYVTGNNNNRKDRYSQEQSDDYSYSRMDCPRTPVHSFGRSDCPSTPTPSFGRGDAPINSYAASERPTTPSHAFGRSECPTTPIHPFGRVDWRSEAPMTPSHPFGRSDAPLTPSHPFGRLDAPMTPSHPFGRSDAPMTPSHPFGRSDAPMTPSHPFGRSDAPMTPCHPYGRSDAPMTPCHPFGRSEAPRTPIHPFGRSEGLMTPNHSYGRPDPAPMTPSHPFGRSDFQHTSGIKHLKDPRLNRNTDYESNSRKFSEDNGGYYKNRTKSDFSNKTSESYPNYRDNSLGRNDRSHNRERTPGREPSIGRTLPRDHENERLYTRDRGGDRKNEQVSRNYNEGGPRCGYHRSQSVGRTGVADERFRRSSSRGPNDNRSNSKQNNENTLSVQPQSGRSFTIDTSVNSTFQEFLNGKSLQVFEYSFDTRRQRAASVGRTLERESSVGRNIRGISVGRTLPKPSLSIEQRNSGYKRADKFTRARSMGRELVDIREKSFREVKAELKSYKANYTPKERSKPLGYENKSINSYPRSRKEQFAKHAEKKTSPQIGKKGLYSPRKNYRDPRMQRDSYFEIKTRYEDKKKTYGIVYSSDNIAKGTILGSGYGVKNYKIPKIKKPVEEKPSKDDKKETTKEKVKDNQGTKIKPKVKDIVKKGEESTRKDKVGKRSGTTKNPKPERKVKEAENVNPPENKRTTRSKLESDDETITRNRKTKKLIIDSDSDSETLVAKQKDPIDNPKSSGNSEKKEVDIKHNQDMPEKNDVTLTLNSSFGLEDLENIFPENMNSGPVLENLDALIADLDNDIDTTKAEDFTKVVSLTNMFDSIDSPESMHGAFLSDVIDKIDPIPSQKTENNLVSKEMMALNTEKKLNEQIDEKTSNNIDQSLEPPIQALAKSTDDENNKETACMLGQQTNNNMNPDNIQDNTVQNSNQSFQAHRTEPVINNDHVVSTTDINQGYSENCKRLVTDRSSTPDSTLNYSPVSVSSQLPDSTDEKNEILSDVLSTLDQSETTTKVTENSVPLQNSISSIGNLLTILQDKCKMKELLNILGESQSGDTEKIKKKLEKLSEIVSDDDEINIGKEINVSKEIESDSVKNSVMNENTTNDEFLETDTSINFSSESTKRIVEKNGVQDLNNGDKPPSKVKKPKKTLKRRKKVKPKANKSSMPGKRVTRSGAAILKQKKPSRELKLLQESIEERFMKDILNASGIRMCRLAKLVDDKKDEKISNQDEESNIQKVSTKPVVIIEKIKENAPLEEKELRMKKKPKPKSKPSVIDSNIDRPSKELKVDILPKYRPGPKSKTKKIQEDFDPYSFDDSISETTTTQTSEPEYDSGTEEESIASSKSFESSEVLAELKKKPKRKKRGWQSGIIKKRRKKTESKLDEPLLDDSDLMPNKEITIPDKNCFTDKSYCFLKNISEYPCRLCEYHGPEIVKHYKTEHPHIEIPLSRINAVIAREAVEQCTDVNLQAISKMHTDKYICRFCFKEFGRKKKKNSLEEFFWHVVSMHTGEYKLICSECVNVTKCPFNLDIPPPPKDLKGQLIGYICGKCNFTQISLENLKTHVIVRHNDEQTAVFAINLAVMSKSIIQQLMKRCNARNQAQVQRSLRSTSKSELSEPSDSSEITDGGDTEPLKTRSLKKTSTSPVRSKLSFENDESNSETLTAAVKVENEDINNDSQCANAQLEEPGANTQSNPEQGHLTSGILDCPHFKKSYTNSGTKEYVCCINGNDNHYKTNLLISMKKHVQLKHSEIWDGYCTVCKVIVMPQGQHTFRECLQHMLDKHMDNFPVLKLTEPETDHEVLNVEQPIITPKPKSEEIPSPQSYINVRPIADLLTTDISTTEIEEALPKIQSVVSLGTACTQIQNTTTDGPSSIFRCPTSKEKAPPKPEEPYKYEEMQAEVMSSKHSVILESMLTEDKLVQIFKCAGRYCSFTTDSADAALLHASTHQRIGGENALMCSYCDYESGGNAIDLVMHVFKMHGRCPYVCGHCFYRAVAGQLVLAHIHRVHGGTGGVVLQTGTVTPVDDDSADMLPREVAVLHYVCIDAQRTCKFKTYTQGKFAEHLLKHTPPYTCYNCLLETNQPTELLQHMKIHKFHLYQCTWCMEGGDNEGDFLAHSSARHPTRQPQAYLRIFTNNHKDGGTKTMVLPLAKLNKSSVPVRHITPQCSATNPAREAEKSLDMEKLIAAMPTLTTASTSRAMTPAQLSPKIPAVEVTSPTGILALEQPCLVTPPPVSSAQAPNDPLPLTSVIKTEQTNESIRNDESSTAVICLDSDEDEESRETHHPEKDVENVIELDEDDDDKASNSDADKNKKIGIAELYKCKNCKVTFKSTAGFKRHIISCFIQNIYSCAHCSFTTENVDEICIHYNLDHGSKDKQKLYTCGMCQRRDKSSWMIKNHMKKDHGKTNVSTVVCPDGNYIVNEAPAKAKPGPKRKLSGGSMSENSPKRIRYGAQDLHKLPQKPILDELAFCFDCEFSTKVRLNLVRHIQQHADNLLVPQTAPVNPVPHLETNEKYFDRMINLASSSLEIARAEKSTPSVTLHIPPEAALRYPKFVSDRQRYTCGAKECSYTSVDEAMLKIHWETLHASSNDFHCVHCPPNQYLDTSKPLTASRIIAHLKMHDIRLYACQSCSYYHYRKQVVEKHLSEVHKGSGQVMVVREEGTNVLTAGIPQVTNAAPTMDLKPWKCGLCTFKSMLRPEVVEHCSKIHNTKMQFKCPVCPFRASTLENVTKHKTNSHPENTEDVFYYYYREGTIPDEPDGTPRWVKQQQIMGNPEPEIKTETPESVLQNLLIVPSPRVLPAKTAYNINLDIVKEEVVEPNIEEPMEALCKRFGDICDPNGLKYKCPLCLLVTEDNKEAMRSHLYEELQYRKWACSICCYKAFHKIGLTEHVLSEHRQNRAIEPIELDPDTRVERWVNTALDHQTEMIDLSKQKLQDMNKSNMQVEKSLTSKSLEKHQEPDINSGKESKLIEAFGPFGAPNSVNFSCPIQSCKFQTIEETTMKNHLEIELNKIRWRCSGCSENSQNYHEAQLHSKTCVPPHGGPASRPVEAPRDPALRAAWLAAVIRTQRLSMKRAPEQTPDTITDDLTMGLENSLLVVRYEERVPTPEVEMIGRRKRQAPSPAHPAPDSDDERLVIDEPSTEEGDTPKKQDVLTKKCSYCSFATKYQQQLDHHLLRHYNLRPMTCCYCEETFYYTAMDSHNQRLHPNKPKRYKKTVLPSGPPLVFDFNNKKGRKRSSSSNEEVPKSAQTREEARRDDGTKLTCLICEKLVAETETGSHKHDKPTYFAKKGEVVVKCCICLSLFPNISLMQKHNNENHPNTTLNYAYFKLHHQNREILQCGHCTNRFKFFRDLKSHHNGVHAALQLKYESRPYYPDADIECDKGESSKSDDFFASTTQPVMKAANRVAKKSTSKLPRQTVARKSTTKLPFYVDSHSESEFSYYGEKPSSRGQFFNAKIPLQRFDEILKIDPVVLVKDCKK